MAVVELTLQRGQVGCKDRTNVGAGRKNKIQNDNFAAQSARFEALIVLIHQHEIRRFHIDGRGGFEKIVWRVLLVGEENARAKKPKQ